VHFSTKEKRHHGLIHKPGTAVPGFSSGQKEEEMDAGDDDMDATNRRIE
jgi:hypothetical protein